MPISESALPISEAGNYKHKSSNFNILSISEVAMKQIRGQKSIDQLKLVSYWYEMTVDGTGMALIGINYLLNE
ncbi:MAG: hypothetical protein ACFB15_12790 [Cyclobacteriaceae bacterium]